MNIKTFYSIFFVFLLMQAPFSQETIDLQFVNNAEDLVDREFMVKVQMMRSGGDWNELGSSNFPFYYNHNALDNPTISMVYNFTDTLSWLLSGPTSTYRYNAITGKDNGDWFSINIDLNVTNAGNDVPTGIWTDLVAIRFNIKTPTQSSGLVWRTDDAFSCFDDNQSTQIYPGSTSSLDISLPDNISMFNALVEGSIVILKWIPESEVNIVGFEVLRSNEKDGEYELLANYENDPELESQGNSPIKHEYSFVDDKVVSGQTFWYKLVDVDYYGEKTFHGPISATVDIMGLITNSTNIPESFKLHQNYPNPFNPGTTIRFDVPLLRKGLQNASLILYDLLGQQVRELYSGEIRTGIFEVVWDGKTDTGSLASSGIYFIVLRTEGFFQTRRVILLN